MIRHSITSEELNARIDDKNANWRTNANVRKQTFIALGKYEEASSSWSKIKPVYMELQSNKCIFCEKADANELDGGKILNDLEHFRPKSRVTKWPPKKHKKTYEFNLGSASASGYHWLAYDLGNYAASCKICNSTHKGDRFPIAGSRTIDHTKSVADLNRVEKPYLCYPIGDVDDDPSKLIEFTVTTAKPVYKRGFKKKRAEIIIDFFGLNARDDLHIGRARMINLLSQFLERLEAGDDVLTNQTRVELLLSGTLAHTNCTRCFYELWKTNIHDAREVARECLSISVLGLNLPAGNT